jgi:L-iditol 2-dehydrogenase
VLYLIGPEQVELRTRPIPEPARGEAVLAIDAATTCGTDLKVFSRGGHPRMLAVPGPFGHEVAGTVLQCGTGVDRPRPGDRVVVANSASCGRCEACRRDRHNLCTDLHYLNGAYADHLLVPERFVRRSTHVIPPDLDSSLAALTEPFACVLHGLSRCDDSDVREALVLGVGPIGLMFVIELAHRGIAVVAADLVSGRLDVARRLGAGRTVLLDGGDSESRLLAATRGQGGADLVIEATGVPAGWTAAMGAVRTGGSVVLFGGCAPGTTVPCDSHHLHYSEITIRGVYHHRPASVAAALERIAATPRPFAALLDEEHPLERVETALRRMADREILKAVIRP